MRILCTGCGHKFELEAEDLWIDAADGSINVSCPECGGFIDVCSAEKEAEKT